MAVLHVKRAGTGGSLESYNVRVYRGDHKYPRDLVGVVEEFGVQGQKAFTNLDELWDILKSIKNEPGHSKQNTIFSSYRYETEKGSDLRLIKRIPFTLTCSNKNAKAETINCPRYGMGIRISGKVQHPVGDTLKFRMKDNDLKAQVKWVDCRSYSSMTRAGLEIMNGPILGGREKRRMPRD
jgi:hypothetical protein